MKANFVEVIDDFLPSAYFKFLSEEVFCDDHFSWFFNSDQSYPDSSSYSVNGEDQKNSFGFSRLIWSEGKPNKLISDKIAYSVLPFALMVKDKLRADKILRVRADMTLYNPDNLIHGPHVDYSYFHYSSIFYLNESDGNTQIFNEKCQNGKGISGLNSTSLTIKKVIEPKPNRLILFDGRYVHTGSSPSTHKCRKILNSNFK